MKNTIWTITAVHVSDKDDPIFKNWGMYPDAKDFDTSPIGFDHNEEKARKWLDTGHDIFAMSGPTPDKLAQYAVIEEYKPGILLTTEKEIWFKATQDSWVECDKPKGVSHISGFAGM